MQRANKVSLRRRGCFRPPRRSFLRSSHKSPGCSSRPPPPGRPPAAPFYWLNCIIRRDNVLLLSTFLLLQLPSRLDCLRFSCPLPRPAPSTSIIVQSRPLGHLTQFISNPRLIHPSCSDYIALLFLHRSRRKTCFHGPDFYVPLA